MGDKAEKTKERILEEAYDLFAQKGFKDVTMSEICKRTGLSRGGLYRYYTGTEEIFSEILSKTYPLTGRMDKKESAAKILEEMLSTLQEEIMDRERSLSLAIYEYASLGNEGFFQILLKKAKKRWMDLMVYGMEQKEFKKVDPDMVSDMILYYYQGLRMWSRVTPLERKAAEHYGRMVREMLLEE